MGSWKWSHLIALLRCLGSKQICTFPLGFSTMAMVLTQYVGSSTFRITPRLSMFSSSSLTLSWRAAGMVLGGFMTGVTVGPLQYCKVSPSVLIQWIPMSSSEEPPLAILATISFLSRFDLVWLAFLQAWFSGPLWPILDLALNWVVDWFLVDSFQQCLLSVLVLHLHWTLPVI